MPKDAKDLCRCVFLCRARQRLVLWDCTLVLPEQHFIDALVFW
jgi:hypothetical protein